MIHYINENCKCGKMHTAAIDEVVIGSGVITKIPAFIQKYGAKKAFVLADVNTYAAAGAQVCDILEKANIAYAKYVFPDKALKPDEHAVGSAIMHFDKKCDIVVAVGSGVLNDVGKIVSNIAGVKYIIVGTAPSMDGYASASSSMDMDGLKTSLSTRCADVVVGDTDILKNAPMHMLKSGIGDMLAKYVSIAEWRIAHIVTGEYYCEEVAQLVRTALKKCVDNAEGLLKREEKAVEAVFEGLVIGGIAMAYAGVSRPASGVEHYFSHVWDMRGLEFGTKVDLHGIQCALGTLLATKLYEEVKKITPDYAKAKAYVDAFDQEAWKGVLRGFLGKGAEAMIALEEKEGKYDKAKHKARFEIIQAHWAEILAIVDEEIPSYAKMSKILDTIGICKDLSSIDVDSECVQTTFKATKDIRDKYVLSRLAWDLGVLDELGEKLN